MYVLELIQIAYAFMVAGVYVPYFFIQSYALEIGIDEEMTFNIVAIMNAATFFGRFPYNYLADMWVLLTAFSSLTYNEQLWWNFCPCTVLLSHINNSLLLAFCTHPVRPCCYQRYLLLRHRWSGFVTRGDHRKLDAR